MAADKHYVIYVHLVFSVIGFTCIGEIWGSKGIDAPSTFCYLRNFVWLLWWRREHENRYVF